jgi:hypothetical protein
LNVVTKAIVPASSSMRGSTSVNCPAFWMITDFPFSAVSVDITDAVDRKRTKLPSLSTKASSVNTPFGDDADDDTADIHVFLRGLEVGVKDLRFPRECACRQDRKRRDERHEKCS